MRASLMESHPMVGPSHLQRVSSAPAAAPGPAGGKPAAPRSEGFKLDVRQLPGEGERLFQVAQAWDPENPRGMSGTEANKAITGAYAWLDGRMSSYLGHPPAANWTTFGKYASREAGGQIQRFEALHGLVNAGSFKTFFNNALGLMHDFVGHRESLSRQDRLLRQVSNGPDDYVRNVRLMRTTLINGNAAIMHNIGPAFNAFLTAEEQGRDGLEAVRNAGYGRAPKDPQGFLLRAFEGYQQAQRLTLRLKSENVPANERQALTLQRRELIFQANLLVGIQEQMYALQTPKTFGNPQVVKLMAALTPTMQLSDAVNRMPLLPHGGNWAVFHERMGFKEVPDANRPGAFTVPDVNGTVRHYIVNPDAKAREGTIVEYFASNMNAEKSNLLIDASPAKYPTIYDGTMGRLKSLWGWLKGKVGMEDEVSRDVVRLIDSPLAPQPAK